MQEFFLKHIHINIERTNSDCQLHVPPGITPVPPAIPAAVFATRFP